MALADKEPEGRWRPPCSVGTMLEGMPPEDRTVAEDWLGNRFYTANALLARFTEEGYSCAPSSITKHRKGVCSCNGTS